MANAPSLVLSDSEDTSTENPADEAISEGVEDENDESTEETDDNPQLTEVLTFYKCSDLLPFVTRIFWLDNVKEALGYIPKSFHISYMEIKSLVILKQEQGRKVAFESYQMREKSKALEAETAAQQSMSASTLRNRRF